MIASPKVMEHLISSDVLPLRTKHHFSPVLLWLMSGMKDDVMKRNHNFGHVKFPHDYGAI